MRIADPIYYGHTSLDYTRLLQIPLVLVVFDMYFYSRAPPTTSNHLSLGYAVLCTRFCRYTKSKTHFRRYVLCYMTLEFHLLAE